MFVRETDGVIRNRPEIFDGTRQAGVYIDETLRIDADIRRRMLLFYELTTSYGKAWHSYLPNTYISAPENVIAVYWPDLPTWAQDAGTDLYMPDWEMLWIADHIHNPKRITLWTGTDYDNVAKTWLVRCATPVDLENRHIATIGNDLILDNLFKRTINEQLEGTFNMIFRDDGHLIAHPQLMTEIIDKPGDFVILRDGSSHLRHVFNLVKNKPADKAVIENTQHDEYLAITKIEGPGWYFVTVYHKSLLTQLAFDTARFILILGIISLVIEITIIFLVLRRQVAQPLQEFLGATQQIAGGHFQC